jgi:hypothetical protein
MTDESIKTKLEEIVRSIPTIEELACWKELVMDDSFGEDVPQVTYDVWLKYWNNPDNNCQGRKWFPFLPDLYQWGKQVKEKPETYAQTLKYLRNDFRKSCLFLATELSWEIESGERYAIIVHRPNNIKKRVKVPYYLRMPLRVVLQEDDGRTFLSALLNIDDQDDEIVEVFKLISGNDEDSVRVNTSTWLNMEKFNSSHKVVSLSYIMNPFYISLESFYTDGRCRAIMER